LTQIILSQRHVQSPGIFFQILPALRAWDRYDVFALREQPGERELAGGAFLFFGNGPDTADKIEILLEIFSLKARRVAPVIVGCKILEAFDLAGQKTAAERL